MRAVVLKIKENKAAVLLKDGSMRYVENRGYEQGTVLELPETEYSEEREVEPVRKSSVIHFPQRFAYSAAACFATLMLSGAMVSYACPVRTVPASSDSSVSLGVNIYGKVVKVSSGDESEKKILNDLQGVIAGKDVAYVSDLINDAIESGKEKEIVEEPQDINIDTVMLPSEQPAEEIPETMPSYEAPSEERVLPDNNTEESDTKDTVPDEGENKDPDEKKESSKQPEEKKPEMPAENRPENGNPGMVEQPADIPQDKNDLQTPFVIPKDSPDNISPSPDNGGENPPDIGNEPPDNGGNPTDDGNPPDDGGDRPEGGDNAHDGRNPGDNESKPDREGHGRDNDPSGGGRP